MMNGEWFWYASQGDTFIVKSLLLATLKIIFPLPSSIFHPITGDLP